MDISNDWLGAAIDVKQLNVICTPYSPELFKRPLLEDLIAAVLDVTVKLLGCVVINNLTDSRKNYILLPMFLQLTKQPATTHSRPQSPTVDVNIQPRLPQPPRQRTRIQSVTVMQAEH